MDFTQRRAGLGDALVALRRCGCMGLLMLAALGVQAAPATTVIGILGHDIAAYRAVWEGFQAALEQKKSGAVEFAVSVEQDGDALAALAAQTADGAPGLLLAVGSGAAHLALERFPHTPVVATLLLRQEELAGSAHATGVLLDFPMATQWRWFRVVLPHARRVGLLLDPDVGGQRYHELEQLAQADGISLHPVHVANPEQLPYALRELPNDLDALWGLASPAVLAPQTAKEILLYSFRNRVPFVGLSANWAKAGALYALDRDYADLGRQCADLADVILDGTPPSALLPPSHPRHVQLFLNLRTAEHMKLTLPEALVLKAQEVYR